VPRQPQIYSKLASWFHLLTAPEDYAEEAAAYRRAMIAAAPRKPRTVLELGSGGGNNASHLKRHFTMTLTDLSPQMLRLSRKINPECEHIQGDMRRLRLGREFDAVFVHDAVTYMTSERDLLAAMKTAYAHCKPGGVALFAPDCTKESYRPASRSGGHDDPKGRRALRYLEWDWDPVQEDTTYHVSMVLVLRDGNKVRVVDDRHTFGVFPRRDWLRLLREAGFSAKSSSFRHSDSGVLPLFIGIKPEATPPRRVRLQA
jgi:SAM-dependent methyltransferase